MVDDEIAAFARGQGGRITSVLPLLDHLARAHPELAPDDLVAHVDAAVDRLYRAGRASFAGHRWLGEPPATVAGFLQRRRGELRCDARTCRWAWSDTEWTENITLLTPQERRAR